MPFRSDNKTKKTPCSHFLFPPPKPSNSHSIVKRRKNKRTRIPIERESERAHKKQEQEKHDAKAEETYTSKKEARPRTSSSGKTNVENPRNETNGVKGRGGGFEGRVRKKQMSQPNTAPIFERSKSQNHVTVKRKNTILKYPSR